MTTVLADCERVIKSRPLTYICEEEAVKPFSSMFMQDVHECNLTVLDTLEEKYFCKKLKYRQVVLNDLRKRFRSEYLGGIIQRRNKSLDITGHWNAKRSYVPY
ncbi:DUF5641 domain-containing protein [Trichonephila clavipes]|nr:DUF5641 domain-containing protein [Trichonephila clavipes]